MGRSTATTSRRSRRTQPVHGPVHRIESLEGRVLFAVVPLDPLTQPKFVNPLPNPLDPGFIFQPATPGGSHYEIGMRQFQQSLGLVDTTVVPNVPLNTTVWGYGTASQPATYPGRTIVAQQGTPITVNWKNELVDSAGNPLQHLLPVDSTLHWADPLGNGHVPGPYTGPVPVVTHLHGGHTRSDSDGLPDAWFTPDSNDADALPDYTGRLFNPLYTYDNDQQSGTLWYHDHALGVTRQNVYAGLAGYYILRDGVDTGLPNNPLGLPASIPAAQSPTGTFLPYEIPIVIQDRMFYGPGTTDDPATPQVEAPGGLFYPSAAPPLTTAPSPSVQPEFFGDTILVNGQAWPVLNVEPRKYRFRILNGSDSRFYNLKLNTGAANAPAGPQITQIGTDTGLLYAPVPLTQLTIGPGERADVVIDFAGFAGQTLIMRNNAQTPFPKGAAVNPQTTGQIMAFRVGAAATVPDSPLPATMRPAPISSVTDFPDPVARTRKLLLFEGTDEYGRLQTMLGTAEPTPNVLGTVVNGTLFWDEAITENPGLGDTEVWEIYNATVDAHPIHLHLVSFQTLNRQRFTATQTIVPTMNGGTGGVLTNVVLKGGAKPVAANEAGWKDTVQMFPGEATRIIAKFDRPGEYVWHCHILSHEDHEMMRPYFVGPGAPVPGSMATPLEGAALAQGPVQVRSPSLPEAFSAGPTYPFWFGDGKEEKAASILEQVLQTV